MTGQTEPTDAGACYCGNRACGGTVEITRAEYDDYVRLQIAAKANGWTLYDILREVSNA